MTVTGATVGAFTGYGTSRLGNKHREKLIQKTKELEQKKLKLEKLKERMSSINTEDPSEVDRYVNVTSNLNTEVEEIKLSARKLEKTPKKSEAFRTMAGATIGAVIGKAFGKES